jgi:hypothetical protein
VLDRSDVDVVSCDVKSINQPDGATLDALAVSNSPPGSWAGPFGYAN